jgi:hypothetical protein
MGAPAKPGWAEFSLKKCHKFRSKKIEVEADRNK